MFVNLPGHETRLDFVVHYFHRTMEKKKVRISENDDRSTESFSETLIQKPNSNSSSANKKKKMKKKTRLQVLKAEKRKAQKDLQDAKLAILEDNERKANPSYTPYENRQKLARVAFVAVSKLQQVKGEIVTKEKENKQKFERQLSTKIKKKFVKVDKKHDRLIKMTSKLERMKINEDKLRAEITRGLNTEGAENANWLQDTEQEGAAEISNQLQNAEPSSLRLPRINSDSAEWIKLSTCIPECKVDSKKEDPRRSHSILSKSAIQMTLGKKKIVADKLAHKYKMTRELRNTIHEHMITRSYSISYFNIIPPYKHFQPKPQKSKKAFNRLVLENKIGAADYSKLQPKEGQRS